MTGKASRLWHPKVSVGGVYQNRQQLWRRAKGKGGGVLVLRAGYVVVVGEVGVGQQAQRARGRTLQHSAEGFPMDVRAGEWDHDVRKRRSQQEEEKGYHYYTIRKLDTAVVERDRFHRERLTTGHEDVSVAATVGTELVLA
jgi:hypothetical protein